MSELTYRLRNMQTNKGQSLAELECEVCDESDQLLTALRESVKLQSHYAGLLNMHDGGDRTVFASAEEWIERLKETKALRG